MNRDFDLGFDKFDKSEQKSAGSTDQADEYKVQSSVRNVCFVWPDGRMKFLNYAYLVSSDYLPENGLVRLTFTSATIELKGVKLQTLFDKLLFHLPIRIISQDERYNQLSGDAYCVNEILENI
ncbi:hypothetical protein ABDD95_18630 [Mucilaginibacter sp. PAMB04274]|uniref:hypothetical protein n=1 Tax=Mucilaginibacter sp. PAMB04274 TaxID=3138568 RepID=UPI0031F6D632